MLKNLPYQQKNRLLLVVTFLLVFLTYQLSIKKTIIEYQKCSEYEGKIEMASNAPLMATQLEKQLLQMNSKIGTQHTDGLNLEQALLELISNYCQNNHLVLREFPKSTFSNQGDLLIETNMFVLEGNFSSLLNLVYLFEQKNKLGKIASVRYQIKKEFQSKEMILSAAIYLQNVKKKTNEK